ncbi:PAS domain S-box protein [Mucilaginibacter sp. HMF5004]|uniref:PAS domain-containing protein n=1 Tax=Mucilaginibacter rivuli TaxID=2857527 RepID=UPI001C5DC210|nr:PAS domain-containing protein [Mucilaginibacter rivuli]MBW4890484.1 PAS domain S-box protein [Mucilaginibacter rivuli]
MKGFVRWYKSLIRDKKPGINVDDNDFTYWQNQLFFSFLVYCFPVSFIAAIPGIWLAIKDNYTLIAVVDIVCLATLAIVTFDNKMATSVRKVIIVTLFYGLAVFLINALGYIGPGIFYLYGLTILMALVFPIRYAYWSIIVNGLIIAFYALVIHFKFFNSVLIGLYSTGAWLALSSNLIFLSIVSVVLVHKIFRSLAIVINKKDNLQERYKRIFDKSPLPMWLFDTDTLAFLDVNIAAINHYGYTKDEFLRMTIKDIRPKEDVKTLVKTVKQNKVTGTFYDGRAHHIKKNGEHIYAHIESNLLEFDGRKVRLVLATDITVQLNNELAVFNAHLKIQESEAGLKAIFESTVNGFVLLYPSLNIKLFNAKANDYVIFSQTQQEFEVGKSILDYVETTRHDYFRKLIDRVYKGEIIEFDRKYRSLNKPTYWIRYTFTPVYEENRIKGVCITGRDVTERKLYVQTVEEQNKTFREISWMQSHLVRAPLARIMGLTGLLATCTDDKEREEMLNHLAISSADLDEIINKIVVTSSAMIEKYPSLNQISPEE